MLRTTRHNLGYGGRGYRFRIGDLGFWICCFKPTSVTCFIKMAIQGHFHYLSLLQVMGLENVKCLTICHSEKCPFTCLSGIIPDRKSWNDLVFSFFFNFTKTFQILIILLSLSACLALTGEQPWQPQKSAGIYSSYDSQRHSYKQDNSNSHRMSSLCAGNLYRGSNSMQVFIKS